MERVDYIHELKKKRICFNCVGENFLSHEIRQHVGAEICSYCGKKRRNFSLEVLSKRIEAAFEEHYIRTPDQPNSYEYAMLSDKELSYNWYRQGDPVVCAIMFGAEICEEAASDIQLILDDKFSDRESEKLGEETEFSSKSHYDLAEPTNSRWDYEWKVFKHSLASEARFFSRSAAQLLKSIFDCIDKMDTRDGRSLVIDGGPGTKFPSIFRARSFQSDASLKEALERPDKHVGSPPSACAKGGRLNAHGISVFYGSNNSKAALAEVRPPVGCRVVVAQFEITRSIKLLDLTALNEIICIGSVFDPTYIERLERTMFLKNLCRKIIVPVMPDDEQFEYLNTQAIADFLANENTPPVDGIIFPSVQSTGDALNIVLFHKAARVEEIPLPPGTDVSSSIGRMYDDGWEENYSVSEEILPAKENSSQKQPFHPSPLTDFVAEPDSLYQDLRLATLRINLKSVFVHSIDGVQFETTDYEVQRHRWGKGDIEF